MAEDHATPTFCDNCGTLLNINARFCHQCGQDTHGHKKPLFHFAEEFLESLFHFDTKVVNTFKDLILKPGYATKNFNLNRRARYVPPFRLYIFVAAIFFFVNSLAPPEETRDEELGVKESSSEKSEAFNPKDVTIKVGGDYKKKAKLDGNIELTQLGEGGRKDTLKIPWQVMKDYFAQENANREGFDSIVSSYGYKMPEGIGGSIFYLSTKFTINNNKPDFDQKLTKKISIMMFILMPFFALVLMLLFRKKKMFYTEHLVFSVHAQTAVFAVGAFLLAFEVFLPIDLSFLALIFIVLYIPIGMKTVYNESWSKTILKAILGMVMYTILALIFAISAAVWSGLS